MEKRKRGRNKPCACGGGKKYKHCCGKPGDVDSRASGQTFSPPAPHFDLPAARNEAFALHLKGEWRQAADRCEKILLQAPQDPDTLNLHGAALGRLGQPMEALRQLVQAARFNLANQANIYNNLGNCILDAAASLSNFVHVLHPDLAGVDSPQRVSLKDLPGLDIRPPLVSVVIPCYNHARYVEEALRSVFSQTYPNIEMIVIDDGSRDGTAARAEQVLRESPFPVRFIARENRGAHATLNEGIEMAGGDYVGILNSDDRYTPLRIDALTRLLAGSNKAWGFAGVGFIDEHGKPLGLGQQAAVDVLMRGQNSLGPDTPLTIGFSYFNHAISTGNLFFTKAFWQRLGGFRNYRYVHDWDFCLRALERESPAILHEQAYEYRMHGANTIQESQDRSASETYQMFHAWKPVTRGAASPDPIRARLLQGAWELAMLRTHQAYLVGRKRLIEMADQLLGCPAGVQ